MLIEQIINFELKGLGPLSRICSPATGYFMTKQKSQEKSSSRLLERPTLALRVPLFLLGHFPTNECEISNFWL